MSSERLLITNSSPNSAGPSEPSEAERELLLRLLEDEGIDGADAGPALSDPPEKLPLSRAQKRLWFLDQLDPGAGKQVAVLAKLAGVARRDYKTPAAR